MSTSFLRLSRVVAVVRGFRASFHRVGPWPALVQLAGVLAVLVGLWLVFPAVALVAGGVGAILWAQGASHDDDDRPDSSRR